LFKKREKGYKRKIQRLMNMSEKVNFPNNERNAYIKQVAYQISKAFFLFVGWFLFHRW